MQNALSNYTTKLNMQYDIISYIGNANPDQCFKPTIVSMYSDRLKQVEIDSPSSIRTTRLKDKILANILDLKVYAERRVNLLGSTADVGPVLRTVYEDDDFDSNFIHIYRAAKLVRKDIPHMSTESSGSFLSVCQETAVPQSFLHLQIPSCMAQI